MIAFEAVSKVYPDQTVAVQELTFEVPQGEICVLIGPSGCGKSTTLRMVNRLIEPSGGTIRVDGEDVSSIDLINLRRNIGYVIQEVALFPHMTVGENIALVPRLKKWTRADVQNRITELLDLVGMDPATYLHKYPHELSGGERQRIGLARAMGADPPIMLMDEPFGAIDPITRSRLQVEFLSIQERVQKTVIFVTHDINEALKMGNRIAIMRGGQLIQYGTPRGILANPNSSFVEEFVGADRALKWLQLMHVHELMTRDVSDLAVAADERPDAALRKIREAGAEEGLVVDGERRLKGVVQVRDLLRAGDGTLARFIRPAPNVLDRNAAVSDVFLPLAAEEAGFLPVVDDRNRLHGILSADVVYEELTRVMSREETKEGELQ